MQPAEVREELIHLLREDLIGPAPGSPHEREVLPVPPSRFYLTGFLVPRGARVEDRVDEEAQEQMEVVGRLGPGDDQGAPERTSARRALFPSSMGASVLVPAQARALQVVVHWGDYRSVPEPAEAEAPSRERRQWHRTPGQATLSVPVGEPTRRPHREPVEGGRGLMLITSVRGVGAEARLPPGTRVVSVFLVNDRRPGADAERDEGYAFQVSLTLRLEEGFVPRPNLRGLGGEDQDEQVAALQYRDCFEYGVGHGTATAAQVDEQGRCREVRTTYVPTAEVERVEPAEVNGVELSMEALGGLGSAAEARARLGGLVEQYTTWLERQGAHGAQLGEHSPVAQELLRRARSACERIRRGVELLEEPQVLEAFRIANRAMAAASRQRNGWLRGVPPASLKPPTWRPFQLAFLLMNLPGLADPLHPDRELVDLLFFPTGGGKTEAYLGLAAFTLVLRRLRHPGLGSAGVSVLMRYTLRLLTLDQLNRAATLVCALELERQRDIQRLGPWPFEIGLWVGQAATPNRMGRKGDNNPHSARARTLAYKRDSSKPSPIPLESCPWCGTRFKPTSFSLEPNENHPQDLRVVCANRACAFTRDNPLPLLAVDEPIYRRLPCFLIATVDKFAGLPWLGPAGALFGKVERQDKGGFYGPCEPGQGRRLEQPLLPPDLIIQDELHLISGPLGTMVGLYETAIDALSRRQVGERTVVPKVVASTATVRRAERQIRALFGRPGVEVFPPPGPDRRDSFFAQVVRLSQRPGRRYVGVAAQGRSPKVVFLRTCLALLAGAQRLYEQAGAPHKENPADAYMTLLGYFNSLRELGGSRRIVEDEVNSRLASYGSRARAGQPSPFKNRQIQYEVVELTSREPTNKVAAARERLGLAFCEEKRVDVALATNMISVGLDIPRLGLMVVHGQPKTSAEYIQATSRVGRDANKPGLVVTLLNLHRPRDRSHYERFEAYHASFYRAVEATSVTPFSPRAVDRGIAGVTVALARHLEPQLTPALGAGALRTLRSQVSHVAERVGQRAEEHDKELESAERAALRRGLKERVEGLLDSWKRVADEKHEVGSGLQYQREEGGAPPLLFDPLDPELGSLSEHARRFKAHRSLRDVEPSVNLWVKRLDGIAVATEEED